jgi:hypothetical protein
METNSPAGSEIKLKYFVFDISLSNSKSISIVFLIWYVNKHCFIRIYFRIWYSEYRYSALRNSLSFFSVTRQLSRLP